MATLLSFSLNIANTINPFLYFFNRPIQVESTAATVLWLGNIFGLSIQNCTIVWVCQYS